MIQAIDVKASLGSPVPRMEEYHIGDVYGTPKVVERMSEAYTDVRSTEHLQDYAFQKVQQELMKVSGVDKDSHYLRQLVDDNQKKLAELKDYLTQLEKELEEKIEEELKEKRSTEARIQSVKGVITRVEDYIAFYENCLLVKVTDAKTKLPQLIEECNYYSSLAKRQQRDFRVKAALFGISSIKQEEL
jgi:hypothetical protein